MGRSKVLSILVSEEEMATFEEMSRREKLPVGTFIRRFLMLEAERLGIKIESAQPKRTD